MSDLLGRAYQAAKGYLDSARGRLEEIDSRAQEELSHALPREAAAKYAPTTADDPYARAAAKIAEAQQRVTAQREEWEQRHANDAQPPAPHDPVTTAYKILGVPLGADYPTVQTATNQLRARCAPSRFPLSSPEQAEAKVILQRVEEAHQVLQTALAPQGSRFDKLEL